jgi:hypothetical protein
MRVHFYSVGVEVYRVGGGFSTMGAGFYRDRGCFGKKEIPAVDEGRLFIGYRRPFDEARRPPLRPRSPNHQIPQSSNSTVPIHPFSGAEFWVSAGDDSGGNSESLLGSSWAGRVVLRSRCSRSTSTAFGSKQLRHRGS